MDAVAWRWSSLWRRGRGNAEQRSLLSVWPVDQPGDWLRQVNDIQSDEKLETVCQCVRRGRPFGGDRWTTRIADRLGITQSLRPIGRPRKGGPQQKRLPTPFGSLTQRGMSLYLKLGE